MVCSACNRPPSGIGKPLHNLESEVPVLASAALAHLQSPSQRGYSSLPHSPRLTARLAHKFSAIELVRETNKLAQAQHELAGSNGVSVVDIQEDSAQHGSTDVAMVDIQVDTPSSRVGEPAEREVCGTGHIVHVGESKQKEMEKVASSIRAVEDPTHGNIDTSACRCMSATSSLSKKRTGHHRVMLSKPSAVVIPSLHHALESAHCNGESQFCEDKDRGVTLHYRLYGHSNAPQKVLFIMGLASQGAAWSYQAEYFRQFKDYQVCIYDNRGVGLSSVPLGRYTTSIMADDAAVLLDHLRWNSFRSVHVVGVSMGGMIAQEVALLVPDRIVSLSLLCTYSGGLTLRKLPALSGAGKVLTTAAAYMLGPRSAHESMARFLFTDTSIAEEGDRLKMFMKDSVRDGGLSILGSMLQYPAVLTHHCSTAQLRSLRFSPFRKLVVSGSDDDIVHPRNSHWLARHLGSELVIIDGTGHGINAEKPDVLNSVLHKHFVESVEHFHRTHVPVRHAEALD